MATAWDKLEQLLTCAICLDRFRNPKMLPCQHSFCQEPCMEGLQDYARRQIKCPECRAEHRIPFQGIQSYPTNVTLQRFLELHQSITGEEPEPVPSMMERCGVCSEKSTVTRCNHCDKKVCPECKEAHIDILKREISRICHQVRRALNRLQDALSQTERSMERLNVNSVHIRDEIEEIVRRFVRDLKAQEDKMLKDLETYSQVESKNLTKLKEDLAIEYDFLKDNCDLVEKNIVDPEKTWNDVELCEVKFIFVKTLDFLRNFDADAADYTRGMKFLPSSELDSLRRNLVNFGELKLSTLEESNANVHASSPGLMSTTGVGSSSLSVPQQSMLMRSQSDHRLATQFARRDSRMTDLTQSRLNTPGYSDSEKDPRDPNRATSPSGYSSRSRRDDTSRLGSRYGDDSRDPTSRRFLRDSSDTYRPGGYSRTDEDSFSTGPQFKSRFMRERGGELGFDDFDYDPSTYMPRSVRFEEPSSTTTTATSSAPLVKVFDTPEAPRGCLSGIVKISDTAHYMERSHENEVRAKVEKEKKEEESRSLPPPTSVSSYQPPSRPRPPSRQVSEDEIEKQKKMNQAASAASNVTPNRANNSSALGNSNLTTTTANSLSSNLAPSSIGLTSSSTPNSLDNYGSSLSSTTVPSSDTIRPVARRVGSTRDDDDLSTGRSYRDNNTSSTTTTTPSSRRGVGSSELTSSSLVDDNDDDLDSSNLSRIGRRRRGSLSGEDSKDSLSSRSSQPTQASSASSTASSSPSTTGTSRQVQGEEMVSSLSKEDRIMSEGELVNNNINRNHSNCNSVNSNNTNSYRQNSISQSSTGSSLPHSTSSSASLVGSPYSNSSINSSLVHSNSSNSTSSYSQPPNSSIYSSTNNNSLDETTTATSNDTSLYTSSNRTRAPSPYVSRRASDFQIEKSSSINYSSFLRSRSPSMDRDLKSVEVTSRPLLSRTSSLEETGRTLGTVGSITDNSIDGGIGSTVGSLRGINSLTSSGTGRYSSSSPLSSYTSSSPSSTRFTSRMPLRLARSSTVSSLASATSTSSSTSTTPRYSDDTYRSYRSRPSSPIRYNSSSSSLSSLTSSTSARRPYSSIGGDTTSKQDSS